MHAVELSGIATTWCIMLHIMTEASVLVDTSIASGLQAGPAAVFSPATLPLSF
jgi:hypothetical protein